MTADRQPAFTIAHLHEVPQHRAEVAALIWREFWTDKPGVTAAHLEARIAQAADPDRVPLCRVALDARGRPIGVVNLVENDDDERVHWTPWLAGLVVVPAWRGKGVGSALVRCLLADAARLGIPRLWFGTDGRGFYARLGAVVVEELAADFCFMRFDIGNA